MAYSNGDADGGNSSDGSNSDASGKYCQYCGTMNTVGVYCVNCGKRIRGKEQVPNDSGGQSNQLREPTIAPPSYLPRKSNRPRKAMIGILVGILTISLVFGALYFSSLNINSNNLNPKITVTVSPTQSPMVTPEPTPTATIQPTLAPTFTPTPTTTRSLSITGINLQFQYGISDQQEFGANSQSIPISNQPNQVLVMNAGSQFFLYFTLNGSTSRSDSVTQITCATPGFTLVSVQPQIPVVFSPGASIQITVTLQAPQTAFNGPIDLVVYTSG